MPLPNFIIIGAMKSGTSTLHSNLQLHPDIGMSKFKEPSYFNERYLKNDLEWYKDQFSIEKPVNGESSPNYSKKHLYPGTAKRMFDVVPDVKIIYLVRDPLDRIISHLHHNLYRDRLKYEDLDEKVLEDKNYMLTSSYFYQLEEYLEYYDREQFLFLTTEELKKDLNASLNKICDFLNVENFDFSNQVKSRNQSSNKYLIKNYDWAKSKLSKRQQKIYHWFYLLLGSKIPRPKLKDETIQIIYEKLEEDIEKYCSFCGVEKFYWKNFYERIPMEK